MANENTILYDVKKRLDMDPAADEFDLDVLSEINSAFFSLYQLGIGPAKPFDPDADTSWDELNTSIPKKVILEYLYLKCRLVFDPPSSSSVIDAYKDRISELEFRMNIEVDSGGGVVNDGR